MRRRLLQGVFLASALVLAWRSVDLMLLRKEFLQDRGDARSLRVVEIPAHRGVIRDRKGEPLAISTPVSSVWANPRRLMQARSQWPVLATVLGMKPERLVAILEPRRRREFVYLKRHVPPALAARVMALGVPGVALQREFRRYYPAGEMAAHVVGFTNVDDQGQEGLELTFDQRLRGEPGLKQVIRDGKGRVIEDVEGIRPMRRGEDLVLSIDRRLQYLAYRELQAAVSRHQARGGSLVLLDPHSGEVLALVNQPSFNPNNRSGLKSEYFRNRAVTDLVEPGSTIKPFTIAAALESGDWTPESRIDTSPGSFAIGRHRIRDTHNYGRISLADVIRKSSNVGASKIALSLEPERLWKMYRAVGFGQIPGAGFPGEAAGHLADWRDWGEVEQATIAFGYGLSVSCLQLARAYTVFANGGLLPALSVLRRERPASLQRVMGPLTARAVLRMLESVVASGTGRRAAVAGYRVAGKTGTVHKLGREGYAEDRYLSLFAGIAPASAPRLVMAVMIDEPRSGEYYGGVVAAPVFSRVMRESLRLLDIPPDAPEFHGSTRLVSLGGEVKS